MLSDSVCAADLPKCYLEASSINQPQKNLGLHDADSFDIPRRQQCPDSFDRAQVLHADDRYP